LRGQVGQRHPEEQDDCNRSGYQVTHEAVMHVFAPYAVIRNP
jgi:hypothetical protein